MGPNDYRSFAQKAASGWCSRSCLFAFFDIDWCLLIGACSCRRRNIFEDVYGVGAGRDLFEDVYSSQHTCDEWCLWLRKAMEELRLLEDGNFAQVGALA